MTALTALHGVTALVLLCVLLGIEEAGVPLPFLPGDLLLIAGGILISNHAFNVWAFLVLAFLAMVAGALGGFAWSRAVGRKALTALGARLGASRSVERLSARLEHAGPVAVLVCRLLPGMRVYTNLAAGALRVPMRTFLAGLVPSVVIWVGGFTVLGIAVGLPAVHALSRVEHLAFTAATAVALALIAIVLLRRIPPSERHDALLGPPRPWRLVIALGIDVLVVSTVAAGVSVLLSDVAGTGPDELIDFELLGVGLAILYVLGARWSAGATVGERLFGVGYHRRRRRS